MTSEPLSEPLLTIRDDADLPETLEGVIATNTNPDGTVDCDLTGEIILALRALCDPSGDTEIGVFDPDATPSGGGVTTGFATVREAQAWIDNNPLPGDYEIVTRTVTPWRRKGKSGG